MSPAAHSGDRAADRPVDLLVEEGDRDVRLSVVGQSSSDIRVDVELTVEGASRLHTRSSATLRAGAPAVTISRAQVQAHVPWHARLSVSGPAMEAYDIIRGTRLDR